MKKIFIVSISFFLITTISSCSETENKTIIPSNGNILPTLNTVISIKKKVYAGEELFRGIFLQQGEVAKNVSEIFTYEATMSDFIQTEKKLKGQEILKRRLFL